MANRNRQKGDRYERKVKKALEAEGWIVVRQSASQFPDLVALKPGRIMLIECKVAKYMTKDEKAKAVDLVNKQYDFYVSYPCACDEDRRKTLIRFKDLINNEYTFEEVACDYEYEE